jgi:phage repressor protein C with HTH and peptisase S24 domain
MIKRLQTLPAKGKIKVISDNKLYESYEMNPENLIINGKAIWFGREI